MRIQVDETATPGASRSTIGLKLENCVAKVSALSMAATANTENPEPGEIFDASIASFPATTARNNP